MDTIKRMFIFFLLIFLPLEGNTQSNGKKPRVIVMTDGEVDDHSSMIRFLLYTSEIDVLAIIETNSIFQRRGHSKEDWLEKQLEAYAQVYLNLIKHNSNYPTPDHLRKICFVGDENFDHLKSLDRGSLVPGGEVTYKPDDWEDTPGAEKIVQVLLEKNPAPVYIQAWGGGNTAARAFHKLKTDYPNEYERAVSKVVMYNIWYQDGAGNYIENYHPEVTMIYCGSFAGTWNYNSQKNTYNFIEKEVKNNHGPLGALYPQDYVSEGDSPAFLYSIPNGLRNHENPTYGGWGGRFEKSKDFKNVFVDAKDDGDKHRFLARWIPDGQNDFEARMDWCATENYSDANHAPVSNFRGKPDKTVRPGKKLKFSAKGSKDPDGDKISYKWWQYKDAGTYDGMVEIENPTADKISFTVPEENKEGTIHIILEVSDNGKPELVSYKRMIVTVKPEK